MKRNLPCSFLFTLSWEEWEILIEHNFEANNRQLQRACVLASKSSSLALRNFQSTDIEKSLWSILSLSVNKYRIVYKWGMERI